MAEHIVKVRLSRLLATSTESIITEAKGIHVLGRKVSLDEPVDYSKEEFKKRHNGNKMITRWIHTTDLEDGKDKLVIVIE